MNCCLAGGKAVPRMGKQETLEEGLMQAALLAAAAVLGACSTALLHDRYAAMVRALCTSAHSHTDML